MIINEEWGLSLSCDRSVRVDFSGSSGSSTNKTDCHDITEILLKVSLNTINQTYEWRTSVLLWTKIFISDYFMNWFVVILPISILMEIKFFSLCFECNWDKFYHITQYIYTIAILVYLIWWWQKKLYSVCIWQYKWPVIDYTCIKLHTLITVFYQSVWCVHTLCPIHQKYWTHF
jgi:hypothetical protein